MLPALAFGILFLCGSYLFHSVDGEEFNQQNYLALKELYFSTNGETWNWLEPEDIYGYSWNFSTTTQNPCSSVHPWQGISCALSCEIVPCVVTGLQLSSHNLIGTISASLGNLRNLTIIDLSDNQLSGTFPWSAISHSMLNLQNISLANNHFQGELSDSVGMLSELVSLSIGTNNFNGTIPTSIGTLYNLVVLDINTNIFIGDIPSSLGNLTRLTYLGLFDNYLQGSIPESLMTLTSLQYFYLNKNKLVGTIPTSIGNLQNVLRLDLAVNSLVGTIPSQVCLLTNLIYLDLDTNELSGSIPDEIGNLIHLNGLDLNSNLLTGSIPSSIANLRQLVYIDLDHNKLYGSIPSDWFPIGCQLISVFLDNNLLSSSVPSTIGNCNFTGLYIYSNLLTSTFPSSIGKSSNLRYFYIYSNEFSGILPSTLTDLSFLLDFFIYDNQFTSNLPLFTNNSRIKLTYFNVENNLLTGKLFNAIDCTSCIQLIATNNLLSGQLSSLATSHHKSNNNYTVFPLLQSIDISNNRFSGQLPNVELFGDDTLQVMCLNDNQLSGSIPDALLNSKRLRYVVLSQNCFTGTLPSTLCKNIGLEQLILDGLHSASSCVQRAIPFIKKSGLLVLHGVKGTIPSCLFEMSELRVLHAGGNSFSGTLPDNIVYTSSKLVEVVLSSNRLSGSIPDNLWKSNITTLDLSLNRFRGTIPNYAFPFVDSFNSSIKLKVNELSGVIPSQFWDLTDVDILQGNMFSCNSQRSDIPSNDPSYTSYNCGSDSTNFALEMFTAFVCFSIIVLWISAICLKPRTDDENHVPGLSVVSQISEWRTAYYSSCMIPEDIAGQTVNHIIHRKIHRSLKVEELIRKLMRLNICISVFIIFCGTCVYQILHFFFSSYTYTYIWGVSGIYLMGDKPAVLIFILLTILLLIILVQLVPYLTSVNIVADYVYRRTINRDNSLIFKTQHHDETQKRSSTTTDIGMEKLTYGESARTMTDKKRKTTLKRNRFIWACAVFSFNIIVVLSVNSSYVLAARSGFSYRALILFSFLLSNFKLLWNFVIFGSWEFKPLQNASIKITDQGILGLCIFNCLLAPFIAEAFVSSDCFVYLISQIPKLTISYTNYACDNIVINGFLVEICKFALLTAIEPASLTKTDIALIPPFHYSYQCSFTLISDFVYVFVFRYLLCGLVEPVLIILAKSIFVSVTAKKPDKSNEKTGTDASSNNQQIGEGGSDKVHKKRKRTWLEFITYWCNRLVPSLWRITVIQSADHDEHDKLRMIVSVTEETLWSVEKWLLNTGRMKRRVVTRYVIDFALLMAFGVLCPPLAAVIGLIIIKDCWEIRLALGRLAYTMQMIKASYEICDDELAPTLKNQYYRLEVVKIKIENEIISAEPTLWCGIWYALCVSVFIWAFVLFDTLTPSVGIHNGIIMVIFMITAPYMWRYIHSSFLFVRNKLLNPEMKKDHSTEDNTSNDVRNPVFEMTTRNNTHPDDIDIVDDVNVHDENINSENVDRNDNVIVEDEVEDDQQEYRIE